MMKRLKGNADCHIPNDRYRDGWDRIFGKKHREDENVVRSIRDKKQQVVDNVDLRK